MALGFAHPHIRIADIAESLAFYCDRLGLVEVSRVETPDYSLIYLAAPNDIPKAPGDPAPMLELSFSRNAGPTTDGSRFGHLAFYVDDLERTCASLTNDGVPISVPPQPQGYAYVLTPDGMTVELLQRR